MNPPKYTAISGLKKPIAAAQGKRIKIKGYFMQRIEKGNEKATPTRSCYQD